MHKFLSEWLSHNCFSRFIGQILTSNVHVCKIKFSNVELRENPCEVCQIIVTKLATFKIRLISSSGDDGMKCSELWRTYHDFKKKRKCLEAFFWKSHKKVVGCTWGIYSHSFSCLGVVRTIKIPSCFWWLLSISDIFTQNMRNFCA